MDLIQLNLHFHWRQEKICVTNLKRVLLPVIFFFQSFKDNPLLEFFFPSLPPSLPLDGRGREDKYLCNRVLQTPISSEDSSWGTSDFRIWLGPRVPPRLTQAPSRAAQPSASQLNPSPSPVQSLFCNYLREAIQSVSTEALKQACQIPPQLFLYPSWGLKQFLDPSQSTQNQRKIQTDLPSSATYPTTSCYCVYTHVAISSQGKVSLQGIVLLIFQIRSCKTHSSFGLFLH